MKKLIRLIIMLVVLNSTSIISFAKEEPTFQSGTYDPRGEIVTAKIKGLVCEFCAVAMEKVFLKEDEVSAINVDLSSKELSVNLKEGMTMDDEKLTRLISDSGYDLESILR